MRHRLLLLFAAGLALALPLAAAEVIPPAPKAYVNDYAGILSASERQRLNTELEQFERDTSNQIVVAIYPRMQSDSSIEDYTIRVAQKWGVGQKGRNNGAVLFIFSQDRKLFLQVGYGLEGAIPDALGKRIIENEIVPAFKRGHFSTGVARGVHAIMAASRGEYKGTGKTVYQFRNEQQKQAFIIFLIIMAIVLFFFLTRLQGTAYDSSGRRRYYNHGSSWTSSNSSSGWSSGGGGGFSGGGGSGGSW